MLIDAFTNSVHVFLNGDGHEPPLPPQKKSLGSSASANNLLKGFSKVHVYIFYMYMYVILAVCAACMCEMKRDGKAI